MIVTYLDVLEVVCLISVRDLRHSPVEDHQGIPEYGIEHKKKGHAALYYQHRLPLQGMCDLSR